MRRWFPERWLLVAVATLSALSAPLWLPLLLIGDFGKWAKEAAGEGLVGMLALSAVLAAVGKGVELGAGDEDGGVGPSGEERVEGRAQGRGRDWGHHAGD